MSTPAVTPSDRPLTDCQQALVDAYVEAASNGERVNRETLGTRAGYGSGEVARVQASRALGLPHVQDALHKALQERMRADAPDAYASLRHLAEKAASERVRLDATVQHLSAIGMTVAPAAGLGAGVVLNLVIGGDAGTLLAQRLGEAPQSQQYQGPAVIEHSPMEGAGGHGTPEHPPTPGRTRGPK